MSISSPYITDAQFELILAKLNVEGYDDDMKQELVDRAEGDLEAALCSRFVVPLASTGGGSFSSAPKMTRQKVYNAMRAKIRSVIALDENRNTTFEQNQRFKNLHEESFKEHVTDLLDAKKIFGLQLSEQASGAVEPVQSLGLARADNELSIEDDPTI